MPVEEAATTAPIVNGHSAAADAGADAQPVRMSRADRDAADRAAFLADVEAEEKPAEAVKPKKPAKADVVEEDEPKETADEDDEDDDIEDELDEDEEDLEDVEKDEKVDDKTDPDTARRLAQVQKRERHIRDQQQARDKAFEGEKQAFIAEWKPKIEASEAFEKLKARRSDPISILKALGYKEDDFDDLAKIVYGHSKGAAADPKNKEAVARLQRDRELRDELADTKSRQAALEAKLAKQETDSTTRAQVEQYMGKVTKAASAEAIVAKRLELKPKSTQIALHKVAIALATANDGNAPDPKRVVQTYAKKLRAQAALARQLGDDAPTDTKKPVAGTVAKGKPAAIKVIDKTAHPADSGTGKQKTTSLLPSRESMIERLGKIQRGELDPDSDD